eukprot:jgi/Tetstr1/458020/TSEL_044529.t1
MSVSTSRHTVKVEVKWDGRALSARPVLYPLEQDWLEARTVRGMLEYAVNDMDPSLSFELVEHIAAVVVVEHELFSSPSSGKKRRRVTGESGGSRMLHDSLWEVMEEVPTRHFKFNLTLEENHKQAKVHTTALAPLRGVTTAAKYSNVEALRLGELPHSTMALLDRKMEALSTIEYEIINVNDYMIGMNAKQRH